MYEHNFVNIGRISQKPEKRNPFFRIRKISERNEKSRKQNLMRFKSEETSFDAQSNPTELKPMRKENQKAKGVRKFSNVIEN